jgi:hypothetical protein
MNLLAQSTSPYLLQHKDNPVDWRQWTPEALAEAEQGNKPILLSVGYAACHWCHVMAHESFEDPTTAALMNDLFVNIKVDREERPDLDAIYQTAVGMMGEQGGWPLTIFLTPKGEPFWGGTYFPPESKFGRPAFADVLREVSRLYRENGEQVQKNTQTIQTALKRSGDARRRDEAGVPTGRRVPRRHDGGAEVSARAGDRVVVARLSQHIAAAVHACRRYVADEYVPGRHLRSSGRRFRALFDRRSLAGAALREDDLRQRAARRHLVVGLAADTQSNLQVAHRRDRRLGVARDAG